MLHEASMGRAILFLGSLSYTPTERGEHHGQGFHDLPNTICDEWPHGEGGHVASSC
jgi:hypothetical protein